MVLTFTCTNCNAVLTKIKIVRHCCIDDPVTSTSNNETNSTEKQNKDVCNAANNPDNNRIGYLKNKLNNQEWNEFIVNVLNKHETADEKLKLVLNGLKSRKNFPRKENKFHNFVNAFLPSKNVPDCAKIIWDIISTNLKNLSSDKPSEINTCSILENSSQKRKLGNDSSTVEVNTDVSEEKKNKLAESIIPSDNAVLEIEKPVLDDSGKNVNRNIIWRENVIERLSKHETKDENLKIVINNLKSRKFLPHKKDKFMNLLATIPMSRKVVDCFKIIWSIINNEEIDEQAKVDFTPEPSVIVTPNSQLDNEFLDLLKINGDLESLNSKSVNVDTIAQNNEVSKTTNINKQENKITRFKHGFTTQEWHEKVMEALNKYQSSDSNLLAIIARLKTRKNIPQKLFKFKNFIRNIPLSHKVINCAEILWDIILPGNKDTSTEKAKELSGVKIEVTSEKESLVNSMMYNESKVEMIAEMQKLNSSVKYY